MRDGIYHRDARSIEWTRDLQDVAGFGNAETARRAFIRDGSLHRKICVAREIDCALQRRLLAARFEHEGSDRYFAVAHRKRPTAGCPPGSSGLRSAIGDAGVHIPAAKFNIFQLNVTASGKVLQQVAATHAICRKMNVAGSDSCKSFRESARRWNLREI